MNQENKLVPKLRFPEFILKDEWDSKKLSAISEVITKGTTPTTIGYNYTNIGINFIKIESIQNGEINLNKVAFIGKECNEALKRSQLKENDILFSIAGALGVIAEVKNNILPANTNQALAIIRLNKGVNISYVTKYLQSEKIMNEVLKLKAGAAQLNISLSQLANFDILMPCIKEQQKIADCLSSLDDLITAENQKLDALTNHKKGLMQQLFPIEGEKVPKLRFPEFKNSGDWNECSFSDLLDSIIDFRGRTPIKLGMNWGGGNIISLSANNVKNGYIDHNAECHLGSYELFNKWMGKVKLEKGDIVFTMEAPLGNALLVPDSRNYILSQRVVAFKTKSNVNNNFLIQLIWSSQFQNEIEKLSTGSTAKGINQKRLNALMLLFPEKIKEQQLISDMLESIDYEITSQASKVKELKNHKKGLMQQLFPTIN